ncbi:MAG: hypothetical protein MRK00_03610 [Nitrosomonas sp.]|nr:hypothetical protein [Nitrosomonas sp.]
MFCYIKEWPNKMATLMTADGVVLCTCETTDEARKVWLDWKQQHLNRLAFDTSDTEPEILPYSPTAGDWLKAVVMSCYPSREKKVVNE